MIVVETVGASSGNFTLSESTFAIDAPNFLRYRTIAMTGGEKMCGTRTAVMSLLVVLAVSTTSCEPAPAAPVDDGAVLEAALADLMKRSTLVPKGHVSPQAAKVFIDTEMGVDPRLGDVENAIVELRKIVSDIDNTTLDSFRDRNTAFGKLSATLSVPGGYALLTDEGLDWMRDDDGWTWGEFYEKYPNAFGIVGFSRIGRSDDGTEAIVIVDRRYQDLGGKGTAYLCRLVAGEWVVVGSAVVWRA